MVRTTLSDHGRLAAGAIIGAIAAALFAEGVVGPSAPVPGDIATVRQDSGPEPVPALPGHASTGPATPPPAGSPTTTTTTTTKSKTTTTTTTTTTAKPPPQHTTTTTTTTTTSRDDDPTTTTTTRSCGLLIC
jgi:hypothetical protein